MNTGIGAKKFTGGADSVEQISWVLTGELF